LLQNPLGSSRFLYIFPHNSTHVNILDICMEYSGESISTVGLNQSPPSIEEVDMYKGSFVTKHSKCYIQSILSSSLVSTTLFTKVPFVKVFLLT